LLPSNSMPAPYPQNPPENTTASNAMAPTRPRNPQGSDDEDTHRRARKRWI
jgi:hypothetical protein